MDWNEALTKLRDLLKKKLEAEKAYNEAREEATNEDGVVVLDTKSAPIVDAAREKYKEADAEWLEWAREVWRMKADGEDR